MLPGGRHKLLPSEAEDSVARWPGACPCYSETPPEGSSTYESKQASETTCAAMITLGHGCAMGMTRPSHPEHSGVGATHTTF